MCGIAGIISKDHIDSDHLKSFEMMLSSLTHRGPDGEGRLSSSQVLIGMKRLSIIDLSHGWQPLWNEDKSIAVIANGEIYNYLELKADLEKKGHLFNSGSDCETIVHAYEEYGIEFVHHLRGMFAICLFDKLKNKVYLFRDRMGEKPLYIHETNREILFSSEMKSLLSSKRVSFSFDHASIRDYFAYQYIPEPKTAIDGVRKLPAGSYLEVDLVNWKSVQHTYWKIEDAPAIVGDPEKLILSELEELHKLIIRSDVPVGVALSGGIDSSLISFFSSKFYPGRIEAFSVGYPNEPKNDERADARKLTKQLDIPLHEIELTTEAFVNDFETMNFYRDDPIADISGYGYFLLSRKAREMNVPVLLQGQGGDELFFGYQWLREALNVSEELGKYHSLPALIIKQFIKNLPKWDNLLDVKKWLFSIFRIKGSFKNAWNLFRKYKYPAFYELAPDFLDAIRVSDQYFTKEFKSKVNDSHPSDVYLKQLNACEKLDIQITKNICETYLLENGIAQGDRLSMASSIELRLPLCDYKLVELVIGLRKANVDIPDFKLGLKSWLKKSLRGIISDEILDRPKKGFNPPVLEWHNAIFERFGSQLDNGVLVNSNILTFEAGKALALGPFPNGVISPFSFKALVLENWSRQMKELTENA